MAYNILCSLPDFAEHILAQPAPKMNGLCTWALILYSGYSKKYGTSWIHRRNITEWKWFKDWVHSKLYLGPHWTSFPRDFCSEECLHLWVCESIMQGVRGATVEKRGKVELSATSRPVRSQREAGRLPIKANLGQKLTRLASSAHRWTTTLGYKGGDCNFSFQTLLLFAGSWTTSSKVQFLQTLKNSDLEIYGCHTIKEKLLFNGQPVPIF